MTEPPRSARRSARIVGIGLLGLLLVGVLALWVMRADKEEDSGSLDQLRERGEARADVGLEEARAEPAGRVASAAPRADAGSSKAAGSPGMAIVAGWGSGLSELGRSRPEEGNPEAPMSFAFDRSGRPFVLDQVNGRIVRYDREGNPIDSFPVTQQAPQDLAIAKDGTTLVLDRLADKSVAVLDPNGRLVGELPVEGRGIEEGGGVTGVFVDGEDVYVEREHGDLVRVGDTSGTADTDRPEVPGRPSRDGQSYLNAGIIDPLAGRLFVNSIERSSMQHRFTRELRMGAPAPALVLLDTDLHGNIYLGALLEQGPSGPEGASDFGIRVLCLRPEDGQPWGAAELPVSPLPEESFRDIVVLDEGGMIYALRAEEGVSYQRYDCR